MQLDRHQQRRGMDGGMDGGVWQHLPVSLPDGAEQRRDAAPVDLLHRRALLQQEVAHLHLPTARRRCQGCRGGRTEAMCTLGAATRMSWFMDEREGGGDAITEKIKAHQSKQGGVNRLCGNLPKYFTHKWCLRIRTLHSAQRKHGLRNEN